MSDPNDKFLTWKINNGLFGWDHEYAELIDKAHQIGLTTAQTEYEAVRQQLEQAQARVAELESVTGSLRLRVIDSMNDKRAAALNWPDAGVDQMLIRSAEEDQKTLDNTDYAQRLRQQADEAETGTKK